MVTGATPRQENPANGAPLSTPSNNKDPRAPSKTQPVSQPWGGVQEPGATTTYVCYLGNVCYGVLVVWEPVELSLPPSLPSLSSSFLFQLPFSLIIIITLPPSSQKKVWVNGAQVLENDEYTNVTGCGQVV